MACSRERSPCRSAAARETTTTSFRSGRPGSDGSTLSTCSSSETTRMLAPEWRSMKATCSGVELAGSGKSTIPFDRQAMSVRAVSSEFSERMATFGSPSCGASARRPRAIERVRRARSATESSAPSDPSTRMARTRGSVSSRERRTSPKVWSARSITGTSSCVQGSTSSGRMASVKARRRAVSSNVNRERLACSRDSGAARQASSGATSPATPARSPGCAATSAARVSSTRVRSGF